MRGASPVATVCRMGDTVIGAGGRSGPGIVLRALLVLGLAGCSGFGGGGEPVPPAVLSAASVDLLEPFRVERQVVADRVDLVLTPNFYDQLWLPGIAPERSVSPRGDVHVCPAVALLITRALGEAGCPAPPMHFQAQAV